MIKKLILGLVGVLLAASANAGVVIKAPSGLNPTVLTLALTAADCAVRTKRLPHVNYLAIIDYSLPSSVPRMWVFNANNGTLLFHELVAHGKRTGDQFSRFFSNLEGSKQSSLGLFVTKDTYFGQNGYSMRLVGLDTGFNDKALERAIVLHGSDYVSWQMIERVGRIGRSWGCPAVPRDVAHIMIDTMKNGSLIFAYYPDPNWLAFSPMLNCRV